MSHKVSKTKIWKQIDLSKLATNFSVTKVRSKWQIPSKSIKTYKKLQT